MGNHMKGEDMKKVLMFICAFIVLSIIYGVHIVNSAVKLDESVNAAWAQVENQYQRRFDLIPNLVNTVKGYTQHEQDTLTGIVEARASATKVQVNIDDTPSLQKYMNAQNELSSVLSRLMAVAEAYPDLKANQTFLNLQSQLEGTENRIAVARRDYIQVVKEYNMMLRVFPSRWILRQFTDLTPKATFEASAEAAVVPKVEF